MSLAAWILLLAAATRVELVDEVYQIPAARWNYVPINLRQKPALVAASFQVESGAQKVRLALLTAGDLERFREDLPHGLLAVTGTGKSGSLQFRVRQAGDYALIVDNGSGKELASSVHLRVSLDFAPATGPEVTLLSPGRQMTVIVLAFAFFAGVVTYSARRLLRAGRRS